MAQRTTKKVKYQGKLDLINPATGELIETEVMSIEERDFNFTKVWMRNFISTLELVGNQKTKLAYWIIDNINKENQLTMNYRQIANASGMCLDTVATTMKILLDANFIRRQNQGCYIVNPEILYKGTSSGRLNILNMYEESEQIPMTPQQKIDRLKFSISKMQKEIEKLESEEKNENSQTA